MAGEFLWDVGSRFLQTRRRRRVDRTAGRSRDLGLVLERHRGTLELESFLAGGERYGS